MRTFKDKNELDMEVDKWLRVIEIQKQITELKRELYSVSQNICLSSTGSVIYYPNVIEKSFEKKKIKLDDKNYIYGEVLSRNLTASIEYFTSRCRAGIKGRNIWDKYLRAKAFRCILLNPDKLWELASYDSAHHEIGWLKEERDLAYKIYNKFFQQGFGPGIKDVYTYVRLFEYRCDRSIIDLLIKRIVGRKQKEYAELFLANPSLYGMTQHDCDTLNSTLMYHELAGTKKK